MNISLSNNLFSIFSQGFGNGLKSTQEKTERKQEAQSQVDFFESQKAGLKEMHCETLEEIAKKLELYNNYDSQIAAVKAQFNREQMMHCLDEAKELGEKIAKAAEELKPKTAEERREEMVEEALGIEEEGALSDLLEDMPEVEELEELETLTESVEEQLEDSDQLDTLPEIIIQEQLKQEKLEQQYVPIDIKA